MNSAPIDFDSLEAAVAKLPPGPLSPVRERAARIFRADGFPDTGDEDWKYTNLASAASVSNRWLTAGGASATGAPDRVLHDEAAQNIIEQVDADWLIIRSGEIDAAEIAALQLPPEVSVTPLSSAATLPEIALDTPMSAFNAALLVDGLRIKVSSGARVERPLGLLYVDAPNGSVSQNRVIVDVAEDAQVKLLECGVSLEDGAQFSNSVTQVELGKNALAKHVRIQYRSEGHIALHRLSVDLEENARCIHNAFDLGGELIRNDVVCRINGVNADVTLGGLYLAGGSQHVDNHTRIEHRVGPATSNEIYRGILAGTSRGVFNGQAIVFVGADGTDANQANHNLLLSNGAEIDTKPELEIYADDVKCSHGATVGQLDENSLYYLRTRGLKTDEARALLTRAFAAEILDGLAIDAADGFLRTCVDRKMSELLGGASA